MYLENPHILFESFDDLLHEVLHIRLPNNLSMEIPLMFLGRWPCTSRKGDITCSRNYLLQITSNQSYPMSEGTALRLGSQKAKAKSPKSWNFLLESFWFNWRRVTPSPYQQVDNSQVHASKVLPNILDDFVIRPYRLKEIGIRKPIYCQIEEKRLKPPIKDVHLNPRSRAGGKHHAWGTITIITFQPWKTRKWRTIKTKRILRSPTEICEAI